VGISKLFIFVVSVSVGLCFGLMGHVYGDEAIEEALIQAVGEGTGASAPQDKKRPLNAKEIRQSVIEAYGEEGSFRPKNDPNSPTSKSITEKKEQYNLRREVSGFQSASANIAREDGSEKELEKELSSVYEEKIIGKALAFRALPNMGTEEAISDLESKLAQRREDALTAKISARTSSVTEKAAGKALGKGKAKAGGGGQGGGQGKGKGKKK